MSLVRTFVYVYNALVGMQAMREEASEGCWECIGPGRLFDLTECFYSSGNATKSAQEDTRGTRNAVQ